MTEPLPEPAVEPVVVSANRDFGTVRAEWSDAFIREVMDQQLRHSPTYQMMQQMERERRWGPWPRTVLFRCGPACRRHYCECGTRVVAEAEREGDPRPCTPDRLGAVQCFDCRQREPGW